MSTVITNTAPAFIRSADTTPGTRASGSWAIRAENLGKQYRRGTLRSLNDNFREEIMHAIARLLGRGRGAPRDEGWFWALRNVDLEIQRGETIGIIGRNGAGKSTLLKILSRITPPTEGQLRYRGRLASLLEVGTGFHRELTGRENIYMNGAILGMRRAEIRQQFDAIVDFAGVGDALDTPVKFYSSGMYVRLAFAVAAHLRTEILVVDEVLAVGDAEFQKKCLGKMGDVANQGRTVLFVSHSMAAINQLCSQTILLHKGEVVEKGDTQSVVRHYLASASAEMADVALTPPEKARVGFRRIWVSTNDGAPATELDVTQPFRINMEFEVRSDTCDVDIGVSVKNGREVPIFFTNLSDSNDGKIPLLQPGRYHCHFTVPGHLLVPDQYSMDVTAHIPNIRHEDGRPDILTFRIAETGSSLKRYDQAWRYGSVLVDLTWRLSPIQ